MKNLKSYLLALMLSVCSFGAQAVVINFDDLVTSQFTAVQDGYSGLAWDNFFVLNSSHPSYVGTGYLFGAVSPTNVGFNGGGSPSGFSSDSLFNFDSAYLTGAWNDQLVVLVTGYVGNVLAYSQQIVLSGFAPTLFNFGFTGIDSVRFQSSAGIPVPGRSGSGTHFAIDNISLNEADVPEPGVLALAGLALVALRLTRRI